MLVTVSVYHFEKFPFYFSYQLTCQTILCAVHNKYHETNVHIAKIQGQSLYFQQRYMFQYYQFQFSKTAWSGSLTQKGTWRRNWGLVSCIQLPPVSVGVVRGVLLRLGLSLGFGSRLGIRTGIWVRWCRVRVGSWSRTRGRGWGRWNITPSLMPLHVPHTSDGLDLRCSGSPSIPVLEVSMFKNVLAPSVAWICVSHPPSKEQQ